jgi:hypothetical protein
MCSAACALCTHPDAPHTNRFLRARLRPRRYDYDGVTDYLRSQSANFDIENWNGHPAKFGIDGEKNPDDPFVMLETCATTEDAMKALDAVEMAAMQDPASIDKSKFAMTGMQLKKGNKSLAKELWTPECQAKFAGLMGVLA